jgi:hypothetical protein
MIKDVIVRERDNVFYRVRAMYKSPTQSHASDLRRKWRSNHVYSLIARYLPEIVPPEAVRLGDAGCRRPDLDSHHKNKAETRPTPFSSVITNERSSSRAFGESVSRPDLARR